jgi:hypothetical protein
VTRSLSFVSRRAAAVALALAALAFSASCGKSMMQQGSGSSYLIVTGLQAGSGTPPVYASMIQTSVSSGTDALGQITLRMTLKDTSPDVAPTDTNTITITGYHVDFVSNPPGLAVPSSFDGALTGTVGTSDTTLSFVLVGAATRSQAAGLALPLATVATVTMRGHDQAGHAVSVPATISVTFVS